MNLLDMRTIVLSNLVTNIICVWFVVLLWRQSRDRFAGTAFWILDFIFQAAALVLIVLRGAIPDWMSMVLANTLVIVGAILGFLGLERFVGKKGPQSYNYLLVPLFIFVHSYFTFVQPNLAVRSLNIAVALLLVCFQCVWLLWRRIEPGLRSLTFGTGVVFSLYCLVSIVRIVHFFIGANVQSNYLQSGLFEVLVLVSYQVLFILLTYSLVLMVNKRLLMQIGTQEEKFTKAFHSAPYAITITRPSDGTIIDVNETFVSLTGYDRTEVMGKNTIALHLWEHDKDRAAVVEALSRNDGVHGMEMPFRKKNGEAFTGLLSAEIILIDGEKSILSSIGDITDRKRMEEALRKSEEKYRSLVENVSDVIFDVDHRGVVLYFSPLGKDIWGYNREDVIGKNFIELVHPDDRDLLLQRFVELSDGVEKPLSYRFKDQAGNFRWVRTSTKPRIENGIFVGASGTLIDITKQKEMEAILRESENRYRELSIIDDLTRLYNARHFYFQLKIELDRSNRYEQPLTLLLLDLDNFKAFNDAYGHVEGDQVLMRLGQVVKRCLRETDFAYRYGGEEFTILLPMTTSADGAVTAERIRTEFKKETFSPAPGQDVYMTVSIGLAQYKPQEEMKAFVHRVDQLMYQGKKNGKDRVCSES